MPDLWMPGVVRMDTGRRLAMRGNGPRIFTHHTFEAPYSYSPDCHAAARYLSAQRTDAHFVFHPITGALVQMLPANTGGRTLGASGGSTNTWGTIHMQVEVIAHAARPWTSDITPAGRATLARLLAYLRSWGIPDQWAHGVRPPTYPGPGVPKRQPTQSGHFHHAGWRFNNHGDPGRITDPWVVAGSTPTPPPTPPEPQRPEWETPAHMRAVQALLSDVTDAGLTVDGIRGPLTEAATKKYQQAREAYGHNLTIDGSPGPATRVALEATMSAITELAQAVKALDTKVDNLNSHSIAPASYNDITGGNETGYRRVTRSWVDTLTMRRVYNTLREVRALRAEVAGVRAAVEAIVEANGMDKAAVHKVVADAVNNATVAIVVDEED